MGSSGFHHDRNYFSPEPWEHFDIASGNLLLTFTDLELPGNAGRTLRFQRTFNSTGPDTRGVWLFGIEGMAMFITDPPLPPSGYPFNDDMPTMLGTTPVLVMADGAAKRTAYLQAPIADGMMNTSIQYVRTADFMLYDRVSHSLLMPDGTVARYEAFDSPAPGYTRYALKEFNDRFGNLVTLTRAPDSLTVTQNLGPEQSRTITYSIDAAGHTTSMSYMDRTWRYEWIEPDPGTWQIGVVHPPTDGPSWVFAYDAPYGAMSQITLPTGGWIVYTHDDRQIFDTRYPGDPDHSDWVLGVFTQRSAFDRDGTPRGVWQLEVGPQQVDPPLTSIGAVTTPSGIGVTYSNSSPGEWAAATLVGTNTVTVGDAAFPGTFVERTVATLTVLASTSFDGYSWGRPELSQRTVTRTLANGQTRDYSTLYAYRTANFADYHHVSTVTETGDAGSRSTYFEYQHDTAPWLLALPTLERVSSGTEVFEMSWSYNEVGFRTTETQYGISTTFTPDAVGNVATAAKPGRTATGFSYSWGQVSETRTPEYTWSRQINGDGTVASETKAGRTTSYTYDALGRTRVVQPPGSGSLPIETTYDDAAGTVTTTRGSSHVTAMLDGFGRAILTEDSLGVKTRTSYDDEGRVNYHGLPYTGTADLGVTFSYDLLDRVTRQTNPDSSYQELVYDGLNVTMRDENAHGTSYSRAAFGDPDDARLIGVHDAAGSDWAYSYNALGELTRVQAPDGIVRSWTYDTRNLLTSETHPESGTVAYELYDAAGMLKSKRDANDVVTTYTYDGNDRVAAIDAGGRLTAISYEPGTDNRHTTSVDGVESTFEYDDAGRLGRRTDIISGHSFATGFTYDGSDNVATLVYPNGQRVGYSYNAEGQISAVFNAVTNGLYADGFTYHPSGGIRTYLSGNGLQTVIDYHPQRYWVTEINTGGLDWHYGYDLAGNVTAIDDTRANHSQTFEYDQLDRLHHANAPGGYEAYYDYDAHGNQQSSNFTYDPSNRFRLATVFGFPVGYDNNGNMTSEPNITYAYGSRNLLDRATTPDATTDYTYDADSWRLKKETVNGAVTYYVRGADGQLLTEQATTAGGMTTTKNYVYAGGRLLAVSKFTAAQ